jgi:hypothetical protein
MTLSHFGVRGKRSGGFVVATDGKADIVEQSTFVGMHVGYVLCNKHNISF